MRKARYALLVRRRVRGRVLPIELFWMCLENKDPEIQTRFRVSSRVIDPHPKKFQCSSSEHPRGVYLREAIWRADTRRRGDEWNIRDLRKGARCRSNFRICSSTICRVTSVLDRLGCHKIPLCLARHLNREKNKYVSRQRAAGCSWNNAPQHRVPTVWVINIHHRDTFCATTWISCWALQLLPGWKTVLWNGLINNYGCLMFIMMFVPGRREWEEKSSHLSWKQPDEKRTK